MTLLSDIEPAIASALNSLGSHMTKRMEDMYYFTPPNTFMTLWMRSSFYEANIVWMAHVF